MPPRKGRGRGKSDLSKFIKELYGKVVFIPAHELPRGAGVAPRGSSGVYGTIRGVDKSHHACLIVKFDGDPRKFFFPTLQLLSWLEDEPAAVDMEGYTEAPDAEGYTEAPDVEGYAEEDQAADAEGYIEEDQYQAEPSPTPNEGSTCWLDCLAEAAALASETADEYPPLPRPDHAAPGPSHEQAGPSTGPAAATPQDSHAKPEPQERKVLVDACTQTAFTFPPHIWLPTVEEQPAPSITLAPQQPEPQVPAEDKSAETATAPILHQTPAQPHNEPTTHSSNDDEPGTLQPHSQPHNQPLHQDDEPGALQPRLSSCQTLHRKSRLGSDKDKQPDKQWVADVHLPAEGGVQKRTAPAAPIKAVQQVLSKVLNVRQQLRKWKVPVKGVTKKSAVSDMIDKVVDIPAFIFGVNTPDLYYRGKIIGPDYEHSDAVVIRTYDDRRKYFFPAGQVREWLEHQAIREQGAGGMDVDHAPGANADAIATEGLTNLSAGVTTSLGSHQTSQLCPPVTAVH